MAYKLKFSDLQKRFIETCCIFNNLTYRNMVQVWIFSGGNSEKIPSSLISKLEKLEILKIERNNSDNKYLFDSKTVQEVFTRLELPIELPTSNTKKRTDQAQLFEERFETHDHLLYSLCLRTLGKFKSFDISFPKDRNLYDSRVIPDAVYSLKRSKDYRLYIEFDNLTEGSVDFSSKLPRYIQMYEQTPRPMKLIYIFKGEPLVRISHLLHAITLTKTTQRVPTLDWLNHNLMFNVYFLTEQLWNNLGEEIASPMQSEVLDKFNVVNLLQNSLTERVLIRNQYRLNMHQVLSSKGIISLDTDDDPDIFSASDQELPVSTDEPHRKLFT